MIQRHYFDRALQGVVSFDFEFFKRPKLTTGQKPLFSEAVKQLLCLVSLNLCFVQACINRDLKI